MNKTLLLSLAFSIVLNSSKAQNVNAPVYTITQNGGNNGGIFVRFNSNAVTRSNVWQVLTPALALGDADAMQLSKSSAQDQLGITTLRYTQMYKGVEVANAEFLLHEKAGIIVSANGSVVSGLNMDIQPGIAESVALYAALKNIGEVQYRWQDAQGNTVADTYYPHGKLVIAAGNVASTDPKSYHLCWQFTIAGSDLNKAWTAFVDAQTGAVINVYSLTCDLGTSVTATTKTYFHGTRSITCTLDTIGGDTLRYSLLQKNRHAPLRPVDVSVYNYGNNTKANANVRFDATKLKTIVSDTNYFKTDSVSGEIYFGLQNTSDYYDSTFHRHSLDDRGARIIGLAHYGNKYANANWSAVDSVMLYGDGDGVQLRPVVGIDITGHELSHGVTQFTAALVYQGEAGALNESFSDMMGCGVEFYALGSNANWTIGEGVLISAPGFIRSMSNPKVGYTPQPSTYKQQYWIPTTGSCNAFNDYCGVHTNSGVPNLWFYLLSEGGTGTNDNHFQYTVSGVSIGKAEQIAYRMQTTYLTKNAQFLDAKTASEQAAEDLYGVGSTEWQSVKDAWCAVGLCDATAGIVENTAINEVSLVIYPNPATNRLNISFETTSPAGSLKMQSVTGALIYNENWSTANGKQDKAIDLTTVSKGVYILQIATDKEIITRKVVKE